MELIGALDSDVGEVGLTLSPEFQLLRLQEQIQRRLPAQLTGLVFDPSPFVPRRRRLPRVH